MRTIKSSSICTLAVYLLIVIPFLSLYIYNIFPYYQRSNQIVVALIIYTSLIFIISKFNHTIKFNKAHIALTLYTFWLIIATILVNYKSFKSAISSIVVLQALLIFMPSINFTKRNIIQFLKTFVVLGTVVSFLCLIRNYKVLILLFQNETIPLPYIQSFFLNPNSDGAFISFTLTSTYILYRLKKNSTLLVLLIIIQCISLLTTLSWASCMAVLIFFLIYNLLNYNKKKFTILIICLLAVGIFFGNILLKNNFLQNAMQLETGMAGRIIIWDKAMIILKNNIAYGIGLGQWSSVSGIILSPHNGYLKIAVELGVTGLVLYLFLIISILKLGVYSINHCKDCELHVLNKGILSVLIGQLIRMFFETTVFGEISTFGIYTLLFLSFLIILYYLSLKTTSFEGGNV